MSAPLPPAQMETLRAPARRDARIRVLSYFSPVLILLAWEATARSGLIDPRFFPPPSSIVGVGAAMIGSGEIFRHIGATFQRVVIGFLMGAVPGLVIGMVLGLSTRLRRFFAPIFAALYPVPKIAMLPLILLIFGVGDMSKYVVIAIGVFFLMFYNTLGGVQRTPPIYLDVARAGGASRLQTFRHIALPAALPNIFTGLKLSVGTAFIVISATEFLGARSGVGFFIWSAWQTFAVPRMFVGIVTISLMGYLSLLALEILERRMIPWSKS